MVQKLVSTAVEESEDFFYVPKLYIGPDPAPTEPTEQLYVVGDAAITGDLTVANVFVPDGGTFGIAGNELLTFNAAGYATFSGCKVGIGIATPVSPLHIVGGAVVLLRLDDIVTDETNKTGRFGTTHYLTAEEPVGMMIQARSTSNIINIGGGSAMLNTATHHRFWAAADTTTVTGTRILELSLIRMKSEIPLQIKEAAAAVADLAGYGQLWVKTAIPCELWFTDDAGGDHQVAYVP